MLEFDLHGTSSTDEVQSLSLDRGHPIFLGSGPLLPTSIRSVRTNVHQLI
jgi:hypothetical protein